MSSSIVNGDGSTWTPRDRDPVRDAAVTLGVEVINGYVIIAERRPLAYADRGDGHRVILGARRGLDRFEYVTAVAAPAADRPTSWHWGHYFDDTATAFERAVRDFDNR